MLNSDYVSKILASGNAELSNSSNEVILYI